MSQVAKQSDSVGELGPLVSERCWSVAAAFKYWQVRTYDFYMHQVWNGKTGNMFQSAVSDSRTFLVPAYSKRGHLIVVCVLEGAW